MTDKTAELMRSHYAQWTDGCPLSFAWFSCASSEAKRVYRECDSDSRRASLRIDMLIQVLEDLISGKYTAFGMRKGMSIEEGPTAIPSYMFPRDGDDAAKINWDASTLESSDHFFDRIRVSKRPMRSTSETTGSEGSTTLSAPLEPASIGAGLATKKGRPSIGEPLREVVRSLSKAGSLTGISRKEQIEVIRITARKLRPDLFPRDTQPSRSKIFEALQAVGLIGVSAEPVREV